MNNSKGSYYTTAKLSMAAFDKLPPGARRALADSAFNWAPRPFLTRWRRGERLYRTGEGIALDATTIAQDRRRVWGMDDGPQRVREGCTKP
jgi:hypothetical protein